MKSPLTKEDIKKNREQYLRENRVIDRRALILGIIGLAIGGASLLIMYVVKHFELLNRK